MFSSSTHVCGVGGHPTKVTEIIIRTISAQWHFATCWTYNSVLRWISRLCSRTCTWQSSRVRFWCLIPCFSSSWAFAICRCSGGSIAGSIAFRWIWWFLFDCWLGEPVVVSSLWWRCCRGWFLVACCLLSLKDVPEYFFLLGVLSVEDVFSLLPSSDDDCCCCCGWVDMLPTFSGTNLPWTCLLVTRLIWLYEVFPLGLWWASLRSAASLCACSCCVLCGTLLSLGADVRSSFYTMVCWYLWVLNIKCDWAYLIQTEPHVIQFERP